MSRGLNRNFTFNVAMIGRTYKRPLDVQGVQAYIPPHVTSFPTDAQLNLDV